jgi:hypothetical protein
MVVRWITLRNDTILDTEAYQIKEGQLVKRIIVINLRTFFLAGKQLAENFFIL